MKTFTKGLFYTALLGVFTVPAANNVYAADNNENIQPYSGFVSPFSNQGHAGFSDPIVNNQYVDAGNDAIPNDVLNEILAIQPAAGDDSFDTNGQNTLHIRQINIIQ